MATGLGFRGLGLFLVEMKGFFLPGYWEVLHPHYSQTMLRANLCTLVGLNGVDERYYQGFFRLSFNEIATWGSQ